MISASLNRCKGMEDQVGDFLKQLAAKLELVLLKSRTVAFTKCRLHDEPKGHC